MKRGIAGKKQKPERNVSTKARPPREEKAIRKRISADAFSAAGHFVVARFFVAVFRKRRFCRAVCGGLFLS